MDFQNLHNNICMYMYILLSSTRFHQTSRGTRESIEKNKASNERRNKFPKQNAQNKTYKKIKGVKIPTLIISYSSTPKPITCIKNMFQKMHKKNR